MDARVSIVYLVSVSVSVLVVGLFVLVFHPSDEVTQCFK